jgi:hypothetical protein
MHSGNPYRMGVFLFGASSRISDFPISQIPSAPCFTCRHIFFYSLESGGFVLTMPGFQYPCLRGFLLFSNFRAASLGFHCDGSVPLVCRILSCHAFDGYRVLHACMVALAGAMLRHPSRTVPMVIFAGFCIAQGFLAGAWDVWIGVIFLLLAYEASGMIRRPHSNCRNRPFVIGFCVTTTCPNATIPRPIQQDCCWYSRGDALVGGNS